MNCQLSIIVPVYNVEPYLRRCIDSILNQTFNNYELILVDDGSTDESGKICDEYQHRDLRIKVIHKKNGGLSSARNAGLDIASGDYIGFIDSDDYIETDMYEILYNNIISENCDVVVCGITAIKNEEKYSYIPQSSRKLLTPTEALEASLSRSFMCLACWNRLYKKSIFADLRFAEGRIHEDFIIVAKIFNLCKTVLYIPDEKYYYCIRETGNILSTAFKKPSLDIVYASEQLIHDINENFPELSEKGIMYCLLQVWNFIPVGNGNLKSDFISAARKLFNTHRHHIYTCTFITSRQKTLMITFGLSSNIYGILTKSAKIINTFTRNRSSDISPTID